MHFKSLVPLGWNYQERHVIHMQIKTESSVCILVLCLFWGIRLCSEGVELGKKMLPITFSEAPLPSRGIDFVLKDFDGLRTIFVSKADTGSQGDSFHSRCRHLFSQTHPENMFLKL